jgi:hypothetical protein
MLSAHQPLTHNFNRSNGVKMVVILCCKYAQIAPKIQQISNTLNRENGCFTQIFNEKTTL